MAESFASFDTEGFERNVLAQDRLVLVDFWSEGCVPCRNLARVLEQLRTEFGPEVVIGTVKSEDNPVLVERYAVRSTPTLLFFKNGTLVETRTGVDRRQVLKKLIETYA
jgi:thioredoxin 1